MKKLILLSTLLTLGFALGCEQGEEDALTVTVKDSTQYLIPSDTRSCVATRKEDPPDITSKYLSFQNVTFAWGEANTNAYISVIQISAKSSGITSGGGDINCTIGGAELLALSDIWTNTTKTAVIGNLPIAAAGGSGTVTPPSSLRIDCGITCGRVSTVSRPFSAYGTMTVIGFKEDKDGNRVPISATTPITIENKF